MHGQNINSETSVLTSWVLPLVLIMFYLPDTEPFKGWSIILLALGWVFSEYWMTRSSDHHLNNIKITSLGGWSSFLTQPLCCDYFLPRPSQIFPLFQIFATFCATMRWPPLTTCPMIQIQTHKYIYKNTIAKVHYTNTNTKIDLHT